MHASRTGAARTNFAVMSCEIPGYKGYASGGTKALFVSKTSPNDRCLVICESAIDCLSHFLLFDDPLARYASIAGKPTAAQVALLRLAIERMPEGSQIAAETDSDQTGVQLATLIEKLVAECGRSDLGYRRDQPAAAKDFNALLCKAPLPARTKTPEARPS